MKQLLTGRLILAFVGFIPSVWGMASANGQENDPRLTKVLDDWRARFERIKAVRYHIEGKQIRPKGSMFDSKGKPSPDFPPRDIECQVLRDFLLDFAGNRHRLEIDEERYLPDSGTFKKKKH